MEWWRTGGPPKFAHVLGVLYGVFIFGYLRPAWWQAVILMVLGGMAYPGDTTNFSPTARLVARSFEIGIATVVGFWIAVLLIAD